MSIYIFFHLGIVREGGGGAMVKGEGDRAALAPRSIEGEKDASKCRRACYGGGLIGVSGLDCFFLSLGTHTAFFIIL